MRTLKLGKHISTHELLLLGVGLLCFFGAGILHQEVKKPLIVLNKQDTAFNVNKDILVLLSAGNKRLISDSLWIQTLMESDLEHYGKTDLKSWMYLRFKSIAKLDPYFYQNYSWGGQYLSIIKDDLQGAIDLMEEGIKIYPDDYRLNYLLGFTYYHEFGNYDKGIHYFEKIMNNEQAPHFLKTLVNKMKIEKGYNIDVTLNLIKNQLQLTNDKHLKEKLNKDFYALKAERDLKCLNAGKNDCDEKDANGKNYVKRNGLLYSSDPFIKYRLKKKGDFSPIQEINILK